MRNNTTYRDLDAAIERCKGSTIEFCKFFMPDHFRNEFTKAHYLMCEALDDDSVQKVNIVGFRGLGKTGIVVKGYMGRQAVFQMAHHLVYATKNEDLAIQKTENLKMEFMRNPRFRAVFGDLRVSEHKDDYTEKFTQKAWVIRGDICVRGQGIAQPFRGLNYDIWRPDVVFVDDSQEQKEIHNEDLRLEQWEHLRGDVERCVDQWGGSWYKIVHADTCKHEDGMTERLDGLPDWTTVRIPAAYYDDEKKTYITIYPEMISQQQLDQDVESARESGTLDVLAREMLARPSAQELQVFSKEHFQRYSEFDRKFLSELPLMDTVILIDPAKTANPKSADTAIGVISVDRWAPAFYVREVISGKYNPEEVVDLALELETRFKAHVLGFETTGLGKWGLYPFETEYRRMGGKAHLAELKAKRGEKEAGKIERIRQMVAFYRRKQVFHNPDARDIHKLEQQLLSFPSSKLWDCMDMEAYMVEVLSDAERFFVPVDIKDEDPKVLEAEYRELEREDAEEGELVRDWGW